MPQQHSYVMYVNALACMICARYQACRKNTVVLDSNAKVLHASILQGHVLCGFQDALQPLSMLTMPLWMMYN